MASETREQTPEQIVPPRNVHMVTSPEHPYEVQPGSQGSVITSRVPTDTRILIDLSPEAAAELDRLMQQSGDSPADLFHKALALYKLAKDAIQDGKEVGITSTPDCLETRFVGL